MNFAQWPPQVVQTFAAFLRIARTSEPIPHRHRRCTACRPRQDHRLRDCPDHHDPAARMPPGNW